MAKSILYIGSPLLDITMSCGPDMLQKYGMKPDNTVQVTDSALFDEIMGEPCSVITSGGSAQNSARVSKWLLGDKCEISFAGCIGKDDYAEMMKLELQSLGVRPLYCYHDTLLTGVCACLVSEKGARSLCTRLGAAFAFSLDDLFSRKIQNCMGRASIIYIAGFFLTHSPDVVVKVAEICHQTNKLFAFNLSAPFVCESFLDKVLEILPYVDILIGNVAEAEALLLSLGVPFVDAKQCAKVMASLPKKANWYGPRACVVTQGADVVVLAHSEKDPVAYPVPFVADIVDTNGCGDALVGGILAVLACDGSLEEAVECGIYAATQIVRTRGCTIPH